MASFFYLAIPDLEIKSEVAYYKTNKIQLIFSVQRDVGLLNYLVKERELYIKIRINGNSIMQTYQKVDSFEYDTSKSYGQYAVGKYEIYLPTIEEIRTIRIDGAFDSSGKDSFFKEWHYGFISGLLPLTNYQIFSSLSLNSNKDGWDITEYPEFSTLTYLKRLSIADGSVTVQGVKIGENLNVVYSNNYYYEDKIKINYPTLTFYNQKVIPSSIIIKSSTENEFLPFDRNTNEFLLNYPKEETIPLEKSKTKIIFQYLYNSELIESDEIPISNDLFRFSRLLEKEKERGNLVINLTYKAYEPFKKGANPYITCSKIDGEMGFLPGFVNYLPLTAINNSNVFGSFCLLEKEKELATEADIKYIQNTNSKLLFSTNSSFLTFENVLLDRNHADTEDEEPDFIFNLEDKYEYFLKLGVENKFTGKEDFLTYPISKDSINLSSSLVIENDAVSLKIGDNNNTTNILNYNENLVIKIGEEKIYVPDEQKLLSGLEKEFIFYKDGSKINCQYSKENKECSIPYSTLASLEVQETTVPYTKDIILDIHCKIKNNNEEKIATTTLRLGRTASIKVSKCFISGGFLTYQLSDWGGDKTTNTNGNNFILFKSSFDRTGNEKLTLKFKIKGVTDLITITKEITDKHHFFENVDHSINLDNLFNGKTINGKPIDTSKIIEVSGTYNYSLSGGNESQTVALLDRNGNSIISIDNNSNNPTLSIRKNGVIINGKPEQELTEVLDDNNNPIGKYYIEINALNNNDRFILKYPNGDCQFEIFNNKGIYISTTNKGITNSASLEDILTIANAFKT